MTGMGLPGDIPPGDNGAAASPEVAAMLGFAVDAVTQETGQTHVPPARPVTDAAFRAALARSSGRAALLTGPLPPPQQFLRRPPLRIRIGDLIFPPGDDPGPVGHTTNTSILHRALHAVGYRH